MIETMIETRHGLAKLVFVVRIDEQAEVILELVDE